MHQDRAEHPVSWAPPAASLMCACSWPTGPDPHFGNQESVLSQSTSGLPQFLQGWQAAATCAWACCPPGSWVQGCFQQQSYGVPFGSLFILPSAC